MEHQSVSSTDPTKIKCPHCGEHECFEDIQALSEKEFVKSYMCTSCGYTSTSLNAEGSEMIKQYEESTAELIKDLRWVDKSNNQVWYPIILNFPSYGIIFPDGTSKNNWRWTAAPAVDIALEEQSKYPIPGQPDQFYTRRVDMKLGQSFENDNFYGACKFIGFIQ